MSQRNECILMCLDIGTSKITNFPFGTNGTSLSSVVSGVPILMHIRVIAYLFKGNYFSHNSPMVGPVTILCTKL